MLVRCLSHLAKCLRGKRITSKTIFAFNGSKSLVDKPQVLFTYGGKLVRCAELSIMKLCMSSAKYLRVWTLKLQALLCLARCVVVHGFVMQVDFSLWVWMCNANQHLCS